MSQDTLPINAMSARELLKQCVIAGNPQPALFFPPDTPETSIYNALRFLCQTEVLPPSILGEVGQGRPHFIRPISWGGATQPLHGIAIEPASIRVLQDIHKTRTILTEAELFSAMQSSLQR